MEEEVKYTSEFDGQTTDEVLKHAKSVKDLTIPSLSNISGFVCIDNEGKAIGMMSKEQVAQVVGGLIGIETLQLSKLVSYSAQLGDGTYKLIDKSTTKGTFRFVYLEDRYQPFIFYISIYNPSYKSEYRVNKIVNGIASSSFKFIYDVEGNIYFQKTGGSRGSILSIQLVAGFATTTIEKVDSVDGTEITIS